MNNQQLTLEDLYKHIENINKINNIQIENKKMSFSENMLWKCFNLFQNNDIININKINIPNECLDNNDFIKNYNKLFKTYHFLHP